MVGCNFMLELKTFKGGFDSNFCYILFDNRSKDAAIIDTSINPDLLLNFIKNNNLKLNFVIILHSHFDHLVGYEFYKENNIPIYAHESFKQEVTKKLKHKEKISLGNSKLKILHTPGHIYDCICILAENKLFTSDTLFIDSCGRCDLQGANIEHMYKSLYHLILKLPEDIIIYPGHDYGNKPFATLKEQKQTNFYLQAKNKENFFKTRMNL